MAKDTWPDLSTRQGFIEAIEQAGQYIRDHASNLLGEYPSLLCEFDITARFRFDAVPTVEIRREHIAAPLDEYQQRRADADSVERVARDLFNAIEPMHEHCNEDTCCNLADEGWKMDCCLHDFRRRLEALGVAL